MKQLHVLNVGQGSTSLQELSNWQIVLIDYFQEENSLDIVSYIKKNLPSKSGKWAIDYIFITHPHLDHIKWLKDIFDDKEIEIWKIFHSWCKNKVGEDDPDYQHFKNYEDIIETNESIIFKAQSAPILEFDGIKVYCFWPSGNEKDGDDIHDRCWILKIDDNWYIVMYPWDSSFSQRKDRVVPYYGKDNDNLLWANTLLASHHGSRSFFMQKEEDEAYVEWLEKIAPQKIIISAGKDNPHGHPHSDVLKIYEEQVGKEKVYVTYDYEKDESIVINWEGDQADNANKYTSGPVKPNKPYGAFYNYL